MSIPVSLRGVAAAGEFFEKVELTRRSIPSVKFGGLKFLDAAHIKDMLALLRFVENPRDRVAGFRLMQILPGVGPTSAQRVFDFMGEAADPLNRLVDAPEVGRRLRTLYELAGRQKLPRYIRLLIDRLVEQEQEIEREKQPTIAPLRYEGWLRRLFAGRLR